MKFEENDWILLIEEPAGSPFIINILEINQITHSHIIMTVKQLFHKSFKKPSIKIKNKEVQPGMKKVIYTVAYNKKTKLFTPQTTERYFNAIKLTKKEITRLLPHLI